MSEQETNEQAEQPSEQFSDAEFHSLYIEALTSAPQSVVCSTTDSFLAMLYAAKTGELDLSTLPENRHDFALSVISVVTDKYIEAATSPQIVVPN